MGTASTGARPWAWGAGIGAEAQMPTLPGHQLGCLQGRAGDRNEWSQRARHRPRRSCHGRPPPLPRGGNVRVGPLAFRDKLVTQNRVSSVLNLKVGESLMYFRNAVGTETRPPGLAREEAFSEEAALNSALKGAGETAWGRLSQAEGTLALLGRVRSCGPKQGAGGTLGGGVRDAWTPEEAGVPPRGGRRSPIEPPEDLLGRLGRGRGRSDWGAWLQEEGVTQGGEAETGTKTRPDQTQEHVCVLRAAHGAHPLVRAAWAPGI